MSETKTFTSAHFPYIPVTVFLNRGTETVEALLDTGFDGDLIIPENLMTNGKPPDSYLRYTLADQETSVLTPTYLGRVEVARLGKTRGNMPPPSVCWARKQLLAGTSRGTSTSPLTMGEK